MVGQKFTIQTDPRSLGWLHPVTRWSLLLQRYNYIVRVIKDFKGEPLVKVIKDLKVKPLEAFEMEPLFLQSYTFIVTYRPGKNNTNVDALSQSELDANIKQI